MKDMITKGQGNSRLLKSSLPANTTWEDALAMLIAGTFPIDFNGLNNAGINQQGTPLNTATLLPDQTAAKFGLPSTAFPKDALDAVAMLTGANDPTTGTAGAIGQFYLNTSSGVIFKMAERSGSAYIWIPVNAAELLINTTTQNASQLISVDLSGIDLTKYRSLVVDAALPSGASTVWVRFNNDNDCTFYPIWATTYNNKTGYVAYLVAPNSSVGAGRVRLSIPLDTVSEETTVRCLAEAGTASNWDASYANAIPQSGFGLSKVLQEDFSSIDFVGAASIPAGFKVKVWGQR